MCQSPSLSPVFTKRLIFYDYHAEMAGLLLSRKSPYKILGETSGPYKLRK